MEYGSLACVVAMWVLVVVRFLRFHATLAAKRLNHLLFFSVTTCSLLQPAVLELHKLATVTSIIGMGSGYLMAALWLGRTTRPVVVYGLSVISGLLGAVTTAESIPHTPWILPVFALVAVVPYWATVTVVRACLAELRMRPPRREALLYQSLAGIFAVAFGIITLGMVGSTLMVFGVDRLAVLRTSGAVDLMMLGLMTLVAVCAAAPIVALAGRHWGWDRWSRARRRLMPLWTDLTRVCPEIVHATPQVGDARFRLHRTTIEIRDCLLILSQHTSSDPELQAAIAFARTIRPSAARDLRTEVAELTALARQWRRL